MAHSFVLAGAQASYKSTMGHIIPLNKTLHISIFRLLQVMRHLLMNVSLDLSQPSVKSIIISTKVAGDKLKYWQNFLELPELKF